jgi:hypothetical protein
LFNLRKLTAGRSKEISAANSKYDGLDAHWRDRVAAIQAEDVGLLQTASSRSSTPKSVSARVASKESVSTQSQVSDTNAVQERGLEEADIESVRGDSEATGGQQVSLVLLHLCAHILLFSQLAIVANDAELKAHTSQAKEKSKRRPPQKPIEGKSRALGAHLPAWTSVQEFKLQLLPSFIESYGAAEDPWDMSNYLVIAKETVAKCRPDIDYKPVKGDPLAHDVSLSLIAQQ